MMEFVQPAALCHAPSSALFVEELAPRSVTRCAVCVGAPRSVCAGAPAEKLDALYWGLLSERERVRGALGAVWRAQSPAAGGRKRGGAYSARPGGRLTCVTHLGAWGM